MTGLLRDGERLLCTVLIVPLAGAAVGLLMVVGQAVWTVARLAGHGRRDWRKGPEGWQ